MDAAHDGRADSTAPARWIERRLIGRALREWESLRGERPLPSCLEFDNAALINHKANVFVVEIGARESEDWIVRAGRQFIDALALNPVGRRAVEVLPSAERRLSYCQTVVRFQKPIADVGRFTNIRGDDVWYRCILLPTASNGTQVNYVVGAFSYKFAH